MGWLFNKKFKESADVSLLHTDIHSHLIPGIDDGSPDMETTVQLVKEMYDLGYRKLILTPHVREDSFENDPSTFEGRLEDVVEAVEEAGIDMKFEVGAEHTMDETFTTLMNVNALKSFHDGHLLIEFPFFNLPIRLKEVLFNLQVDGYKLILAHPERYAEYLARDFETLESLKDRGILFQMNVLSLDGYYGSHVLKFAKYLVKNDYIDILGSDLHNIRHIEAMKKAFKNPMIKDLIESGRLINNKF